MAIPNQDQLIDYLESSIEKQPVSLDQDLTLESPYRTNIMTSRKAREKTRRNLKDLEKITGETFGITI